MSTIPPVSLVKLRYKPANALLSSRESCHPIKLLEHNAKRNTYSGIYVPNTDAYPAHFRGMGIRIEDSVCVQEEHPLVLTTEAVKEVCCSLHA